MFASFILVYYLCFNNKANNNLNTKEMKQVTREEYLNSFMNLDSVLFIDTYNGYPYTSKWYLRGTQKLLAKSVGRYAEGTKYPVIYDYFIA